MMRFGLQLHGTLPLDAYGRLAASAESLGFHDVTVHDVILRRPVWPLLCDVARATTTVQVGPNVTHPHFQHPVVIAANIAHLDDVSGGRAVLGLGRGSMYHLVGQQLPAGYGSLEEAVRVVDAVLAGEGQPVEGERFELASGVRLSFGAPRRVPVHLGVYGPTGARVAGRIADGVRAAAQWDPAYAVELHRWITGAAEAAGRDPGSVPLTLENWTYLHPDRDQARRDARRVLATFLPHLGTMLDFYRIDGGEVDAASAVAAGDDGAIEGISEATVDRFMAAGDAGDLRRGLDRLAEAGFDSISFSGVLGPDPDLALAMIGDEIKRRSGIAGPTSETSETSETNGEVV